MADQVRLVYRGQRQLAGVLAATLEGEGLATSWEPPLEWRTLDQIEAQIEFLVVSGGGLAATIRAVKAGVDKFKARFPNTDIEIDHTTDDEQDSAPPPG